MPSAQAVSGLRRGGNVTAYVLAADHVEGGATVGAAGEIVATFQYGPFGELLHATEAALGDLQCAPFRWQTKAALAHEALDTPATSAQSVQLRRKEMRSKRLGLLAVRT